MHTENNIEQQYTVLKIGVRFSYDNFIYDC